MPGRSESERLLSGYAGRLSISLALATMAIKLGREAIPPLLPAIIDDLAISPGRAGFAVTVLWAVYSLNQYPGGRLSDQLSRKTVLVASFALTAAGFAALSAVSSYPGLLLSIGLLGFGAGLHLVPMRALLSDLYAERRGQAFGINLAAGGIGSAAAAGLAVAALAVATWQAAFLPVIVVLGAVAALFHVWSRERYVIERVDLGVRESVAHVLEAPQIRRLVVAFALLSFFRQGTMNFLPTLLQVEKGFSPALASGNFALIFVVGIAISPIAGRLGDRLAHTTVALAGMALALGGVLAFLATDSVAAVAVGVALYATGVWTVQPVMQAYLMDQFSDDSMGGDFGAFRTIYLTLASFGPTFVGVVAGRASYTVGFLGLLACLIASATIVLRVARSEATT